MSPDPGPDRRPGFLLGQPLWVTTTGTEDARWSLAANEADPGDGDRIGPGFRPPPDPEADQAPAGGWDRVPRDELVRRAVHDPSWKRVGLVCGAGLGKTTTLEWLESAVNRLPTGECPLVAFFRELEGIPTDGEDLLAELAARFRATPGIDRDAAEEYLKKLRAGGRVLLLLDSLDQADPDPKGPAVAALKNLYAGRWAGCRIWVSGRPYAFRQAGLALRRNYPNQPWAFVRVGQLATPECKQLLETTDLSDLPRERYPKPHRFDDLNPAARRFAHVPRYGRLIAMLPPESLARLTSEAAVFRELYRYVALDPDAETGLLDSGLRPEKARRLGWHHLTPPADMTYEDRESQAELAHALLGAAAFEMFVQGTGQSERHHLFRVEARITPFIDRVRDRLVRAGAYLDSARVAIPPQYFRADWAALLAMDSHGLKNFIFSADGRDGLLRWTDVSTAAYFAAWWACRWGGADERGCARQWVVDPLTDENAAFHEFWSMACDLPGEAVEPDRRVELLSLLYATPDRKRPTARSTEFIDRTWEFMTGTPAQNRFLADPNRLRLTRNPDWLRGFIALARPTSTLPRDTREFVMGAPKTEDRAVDTDPWRQINNEHLVRLKEYALHRFCVTNREYELFDPRHEHHRWGPNTRHPSASETKSRADDDCPVVMVSWYDARCFARWLGEVEIDGRTYELALPTEAQWEYACRAGRRSPFTFDDGHDGESGTPDLCNFDGNAPFPKTAEEYVKTLPEKVVYRRHTIPVGALGPNPWGFYQMHGNVFELCTDWFITTFYPTGEGVLIRATENPVNLVPAGGRVLRGGCWYWSGRFCRSAYRYARAPASRGQLCGFRLAAVPAVGAEPSQSGTRGG